MAVLSKIMNMVIKIENKDELSPKEECFNPNFLATLEAHV